jgi:membrane-bound serine protease (ClpP class)
LGEAGFVKDRTDPEGLVFVHGEYWRAKAKEKLEPEDEMDGL